MHFLAVQRSPHFQESSSLTSAPALADGAGSGWASWKGQSASWRAELDAPLDYAPYTKNLDLSRSGLSNNVTGQPPKRVLDLIDCTAMAVSSKARKTLPECRSELAATSLDVSQSHQRRPYSQGCCRTLTTSSRIFAFSQNRLLCAREHMMLQGFDENLVVPKQISESALRRFAGEGMGLPCLGTVLLAVLLTRDLS
eukprot:s69_g7.t1